MGLEAREEPSRSQLRWFGVVILLATSVVGSVLFWRLGLIWGAYLVWGFGVCLVVPYYLVPRLRESIFRGWMGLVMPLGSLMTHVLLALVYFLLLTPIGLASRLLGRDVLGRRKEERGRTRWREHDPGGDGDRYFRQT